MSTRLGRGNVGVLRRTGRPMATQELRMRPLAKAPPRPATRILAPRPEVGPMDVQLGRADVEAAGLGRGVDETEIICRLASSLWTLANQDFASTEKRFSVGTVPKRAFDKYVMGLVGFLNDNHDGEATTAGVSPGLVAVVVAVIFVDRLMQKHPDFTVCRSNVHRLFLTAITLAAKTWRDRAIPNKFMAAVGGIPLEQLNAFELEFCKMVGFDLSAHAEDFWHSLALLIKA